jgi:5-methylcytosine-specific restriction endonuclease McrA
MQVPALAPAPAQNHSTVRTIFRSIPPTTTAVDDKSKKRKQNIPKAVREQLWIRDMGHVFEGKCKVSWCTNKITVFDFQCGHNIPESKGGETALPNLMAICARCNTSMGDRYTIDEWSKMHQTTQVAIEAPRPKSIWRFFRCFSSTK